LLSDAAAVLAAPRIKVVATFSILGDLMRNVGGDRVEIATLVGPDGDVHVYEPTPADAGKLRDAALVVVNGLGLEGWMTRLIAASATKAPTVIASDGISPRKTADAHQHMVTDPHAWQSIANARIYVANIRDGLIRVDPVGTSAYEANAKAYFAAFDALESEIKAAIDKVPADHRRVITTHDAFGYFGDAYGMEFIAPEGVSTETQASAQGMAKIITQIKRAKIPAVFMENISDPRMIQQIARETGARIGGTLYSDALSAPGGPASTYIDMMRNNVREFSAALTN
jgi:zinc/manganese transport system substrate-binding protein